MHSQRGRTHSFVRAARPVGRHVHCRAQSVLQCARPPEFSQNPGHRTPPYRGDVPGACPVAARYRLLDDPRRGGNAPASCGVRLARRSAARPHWRLVRRRVSRNAYSRGGSVELSARPRISGHARIAPQTPQRAVFVRQRADGQEPFAGACDTVGVRGAAARGDLAVFLRFPVGGPCSRRRQCASGEGRSAIRRRAGRVRIHACGCAKGAWRHAVYALAFRLGPFRFFVRRSGPGPFGAVGVALARRGIRGSRRAALPGCFRVVCAVSDEGIRRMGVLAPERTGCRRAIRSVVSRRGVPSDPRPGLRRRGYAALATAWPLHSYANQVGPDDYRPACRARTHFVRAGAGLPSAGAGAGPAIAVSLRRRVFSRGFRLVRAAAAGPERAGIRY